MIAFTFPGQGSQRPGMGAPWTDHPSWELVAEASDAVGRDVRHLLLDADADELTQTRNSQLATLVLSLVVLDAVERTGLEPGCTGGHSLGEYTALVAAGTLSFGDGVRLVAERGEAMGEAGTARPGTMAAVLGLDDDDVEIACARVDGDVWVANLNGPGQAVIAGAPAAVAEAGAAAKELGAKKVLPLPVSGAFHTPYMAPARDRLRAAIAGADLRDPQLPVVANVDARVHERADEWAGLLAAQLCSPVRWRQCLHTLADLGAATFVELGPGTVLTGLAKRAITGARALSVGTPADLDRLLESVHGQEDGPTGVHEGEHLFATERLVVSPAAGVFEPDPGLEPGLAVRPGQVVGRVGGHEVRSAFAGAVIGVLALAGERLTASQPVAWMRTT